MNPRKHLILIKNEIKTPDIKSCQYNPATQKMDVQFNNGKTYSYAYANVEWLKEPYVINPNMFMIGREGRIFFGIEAIYAFEGMHDTYWHICFSDGSERDYPKSALQILESCLNQEQSANVFDYIKQIAYLSDLRNEETGEKILAKRIEEIENYLQSVDHNLLDDLCNQSMLLLKNKLAKKYEGNETRKIFTEDDLWQNSYDVLQEYPVILSTTFSSRNSLKEDVVYDYLIMDEASQVDVATGALALSCARNVVIVGDTRQLPNVVTDDVRIKAQAIYDSFNIHEGYRFTKSFLQSVLDVMPNVTQTLLREHYRCHPKMINFCNRGFYSEGKFPLKKQAFPLIIKMDYLLKEGI